MPISLDEVNRIAKLARLNFTPSEKLKLQKELSDILNYVELLSGLKEKAGETLPDPSSLNLVRDDVVQRPDDAEEFLKQAPGRDGSLIKVKSVLE
jgi:aspartyl-tRNA(Asn)/glutamyl-tRNA(Gln) amidotransferase subunit C